MSDSDLLGPAKTGVEVLGELVKAAGDSPSAKEAAGNVGEVAVILTKAVKNCLLPLAAVNFAFDKAREYFATRFESDLERCVQRIPAEHLIEPKASIAGPTLQGLAFSHEENNLRELYLNLLATSMDGRCAPLAHPAFVEIIKQFDAEDAQLVQGVLLMEGAIAIVRVVLEVGANGSHTVLMSNLLDLTTDDGTPIENERLPSMVDNWERLGLVEVSYGPQLTSPVAYDWVIGRPEYVRFLNQHPTAADVKLNFHKGIMRRTHLGKRFAASVGLLGPASDQ